MTESRRSSAEIIDIMGHLKDEIESDPQTLNEDVYAVDPAKFKSTLRIAYEGLDRLAERPGRGVAVATLRAMDIEMGIIPKVERPERRSLYGKVALAFAYFVSIVLGSSVLLYVVYAGGRW